MSSFDPPLSRRCAGLLALGALLVCAWLLYAAHLAPRAATTTVPVTPEAR
jgi:hypothetical protein